MHQLKWSGGASIWLLFLVLSIYLTVLLATNIYSFLIVHICTVIILLPTPRIQVCVHHLAGSQLHWLWSSEELMEINIVLGAIIWVVFLRQDGAAIQSLDPVRYVAFFCRVSWHALLFCLLPWHLINNVSKKYVSNYNFICQADQPNLKDFVE